MSALNGTFNQTGFPNILELIPLCETVKKLSSICKMCGNDANFTYRSGLAADPSQPQIGGADQYMPLCRECLDFSYEQRELNDKKALSKQMKVSSSPLKQKDMNTNINSDIQLRTKLNQ